MNEAERYAYSDVHVLVVAHISTTNDLNQQAVHAKNSLILRSILLFSHIHSSACLCKTCCISWMCRWHSVALHLDATLNKATRGASHHTNPAHGVVTEGVWVFLHRPALQV